MRVGLAEGELYFMEPNSQLPEIDSFIVLLHGSLMSSNELLINNSFILSPIKQHHSTYYEIQAPFVLPWGFQFDTDTHLFNGIPLFNICHYFVTFRLYKW